VQPDINNIEVPDWIAGGSGLLLLIALFLPWTRVSISVTGAAKASGTWGASFGWISIISVLAVAAIFVVTLLDVDLPFPTGLAYLGAGGLALLLTILMMLFRPIPGAGLGLSISGVGISKIPWIGAFIGFIACAGILVGGWMKFQAQRY
jgi:hypothetical protein